MRYTFQCFGIVLAALALTACGSTNKQYGRAYQEEIRRKHDIPGQVKIGNPYEISGETYYPDFEGGYDKVGVASWYGPGFHGKSTASGEKYNQYALTAAHPTLPLPSLVKVTNLANDQSVVVRINDRGPFASNRIIDLSKKAAQEIGLIQSGTGKVRVHFLDADTRQVWAMMRDGMSAEEAVVALRTAPPAEVQMAAASTPVEARDIDAPEDRPTEQVVTDVSGRDEAANLGTTLVQSQALTGVYVQAGAFSDPENARRAAAQVASLGSALTQRVQVGEKTVYRVRLGPLMAGEDPSLIQGQLVDLGFQDAKVIAH